MRKIIGYARVSTHEQNLGLQIRALNEAGCYRIYKDHGVSGTKQSRPGLDRALKTLSTGDVLVIWRLDRLGRSLTHLVRVVSELEERGVEFRSLHDQFDTTTATGKLIFHILAALAEFERNLTRERTIAGIQEARSRGVRFGRPCKLTPAKVRRAQKELIKNKITMTALAEQLNVSRTTLRRSIARLCETEDEELKRAPSSPMNKIGKYS